MGVLSHPVTPVPSAQVGGSPPNAAEDPFARRLLLALWPRTLPLLCPSQQSPLGIPKEDAKGDKCHPPPGPNVTPSGTLGLCTATGSAPSKMPGTFCTGAGWGDSDAAPTPPQAGTCWLPGGDMLPFPARSGGRGHCPVPLGLYFFLSFH